VPEKQTVRSILGQSADRVPANLGRIFKGLLYTGDINKISCMSTGKPTISKNPPTQQPFNRNRHGEKDQRAIIPCQYKSTNLSMFQT